VPPALKVTSLVLWCCHQDYRGTAPFSEPETQAIRDFTAQHDFAVALNFHSYGDFVNIPFATNKGPTHGELPPNDRRIYHSLVADMTQVNHFRSGHAWAEVCWAAWRVVFDWLAVRLTTPAVTLTEFTVHGQRRGQRLDVRHPPHLCHVPRSGPQPG